MPESPEPDDLPKGKLQQKDGPSPILTQKESSQYSAGLEFALTILVFVFIGWFLDSKIGTLPLFLILFMFLGFGGALYSMVRKFSNDSATGKNSDTGKNKSTKQK